MKNYWLSTKNSEYGEICLMCGEEMWPFNDATTLTQGDPLCACYNYLGEYYSDAFVQNEKLDRIGGCNNGSFGHSVYQTTYVPVLPNTMSGVVFWDFEGIQVARFIFSVNSQGVFDFKRVDANNKPPTSDEGDNLTMYYDEIYSDECKLNCQTGVLEISWHGSGHPEIAVNYEYGLIQQIGAK